MRVKATTWQSVSEFLIEAVIVLFFIIIFWLLGRGLSLISLITRENEILEKNDFYLVEENWRTVPQGCYKSMTEIKIGSYSSSASLVHTQITHSTDKGTVVIYYLLTANHVIKSAEKDSDKAILENTVVLKPGKLEASHNYGILGYSQLISDKGKKIDSGFLAIYQYHYTSDIRSESYKEIGIEKLYPGNGFLLGSNHLYFGFGYPSNVLQNPQYTISTKAEKTNPNNANNYVYLTIHPDFGNVTKGNSGGAICNEQGEIVGIVTKSDSLDHKNFVITRNPSNIRQQLQELINLITSDLNNDGYTETKNQP